MTISCSVMETRLILWQTTYFGCQGGSRGMLEHFSLQTLYVDKLCKQVEESEVKGRILQSRLHQTCIMPLPTPLLTLRIYFLTFDFTLSVSAFFFLSSEAGVQLPLGNKRCHS